MITIFGPLLAILLLISGPLQGIVLPALPQQPVVPTLVVQPGVGVPGGTATLLVRLDAAGIAVRSYQVNLAYDEAVFPAAQARRADGTPDAWSFHQHSPAPGDLRTLAFSFNPADFEPLPADCEGWCQPAYRVRLTVASDAPNCTRWPVAVALQDVRDAGNEQVSMVVAEGYVWVNAGNGSC